MLLVTVLILMPFSPIKSLAATAINKTYTEAEFISGEISSIPLYIHKKSLAIDLRKTRKIKLAVDLTNYYTRLGRNDSFSIKVYDLNYGTRELINKSKIRIHKPKSRYKVFYLNLGDYKNPNRDIEIDLLDHNNNLINTYSTSIQPQNISSQTNSVIEKITSADCDNTEFNECQLDYIIKNLDFESRTRKDLSTETLKKEDGSYLVTIPSLRSNRTVKNIKYQNKTKASSNSQRNISIANINDEIKTISTDYEISSLDSIIIADSSNSSIELTLPSPGTTLGLKITCKKIDDSNNKVILKSIGYTIDGVNKQSLDYQYEAINLVSTGTEWLIF